MALESVEELRVFAQVVESGSLAAAAKALGMPPITVSRRLASLEGRVGRKLINRTTRSSSLSEHGRTLLARAQRILAEVEAAELALQREADGLSGVVRIAVPSVLVTDMLACLAPLMRRESALRLDIRVRDRVVNPVAEGVDVVVMGGAQSDSTLIARKLVDVTLILAASRNYLDAHGRPATPGDLFAHETVHFRTEPPQSTWVLSHRSGQEEVARVEGRLEVDDGRGVLDAIRGGLGIGMTSPRVVSAHPELERVLPDWVGTRFPVYAIYPTSGERSARLQAVVAALQETLGRAPTA